MKSYKVILSGGGTGGHIYPAIAIANELKFRFPMTEFLFVGAKCRKQVIVLLVYGSQVFKEE